MAIGSIAPNVVIAQILSPLTIVLMMLFGGFYVNIVSFPFLTFIYLSYSYKTQNITEQHT